MFIKIFLIFVFLFNIVNCNLLDENESGNVSNEHSINLRAIPQDNVTSNDDEMDSFDENNLGFSYQEFFERLKPDDYEKNKLLKPTKIVQSPNDTINIVTRLIELASSLPQKLAQQFSVDQLIDSIDLLMEIDISSECLAGLFKTYQAIQRRELWSLKCKNTLINLKIKLKIFKLINILY